MRENQKALRWLLIAACCVFVLGCVLNHMARKTLAAAMAYKPTVEEATKIQRTGTFRACVREVEQLSTTAAVATAEVELIEEHPEVASDPEPVSEPVEESNGMSDLEMLALVIYQEAGGDDCSNDTRLKVGTVVMNRVASSRYPDTLEEVLTQKQQYGRLHWTGLVWPERSSNSGEAHAVDRAYECAERLLSGERFLPDDVIYQAEFPQGTETVSEQDGFYFCR